MSESVKSRFENELIKSPEDDRHYRYLVLKNNMKVLVVSDPTTDKSAAALDVHVGSMSDPWDIPGLAHFCEHMLFLGTEKYPCENEYNKYLSENSGSSNAYTATDHTNYYFDVAPDAFNGALDRFAQFFLKPLFKESCVEREVNAVNSEHEKNIQNDYWRFNQLERSTSHSDHPFTKFGTGSKVTLFEDVNKRGECVRDCLLEFHKKWYSANAMAVSVLGKETLDELEEMVVSLFSDVEDKNITIPSWPEHPFTEAEFKKIGYIVPVKDIRTLTITWPLPDMLEHYKTSPVLYLGHLIGHEGKGSLLSLLKEKGWVTALISGQKSGAKGFCFFVLNVYLSKEGMDHTDDIVTATFQYLQMLIKEGPKEWIFDEAKDTSEMAFRFKDKEIPQSFVSGIAESIHEYPPKDLLWGGYILKDYDEVLISTFLQKLTPDKARISIVSKTMADKVTMTEKWYGTEYHYEDIPEEKIEAWTNAEINPALSLPKPNDFIPKNLSLCTKDEDVTTLPQIIHSTPVAKVWYKQDREYKLPKSVLYTEFYSPISYLDPHNTNMLHMLAAIFRDAITEYAYDAELAGLDYHLTNSKYGLTLLLKGYYDKQPILLQKVMDILTSFKINPVRFDMIKDTYIRALNNFNADQPHQHVVYYTSLLLSEHGWSKELLVNSANETLTIEALEKFIPEFLSRLHCNIFVHGTVSKDWALNMASIITKGLEDRATPTKPLIGHKKRLREMRINKGESYVYKAKNDVHSNSAIEFVLQNGMQSTLSNSLGELVAQILHEPVYDELRTKEQLGYIIWSGLRRSNGTQGFRVIIQSPFSPEHLEGRIEAFIFGMGEVIKTMPDDQYIKHRDALIKRRLEKPKKMFSLTMSWWTEIVCNQLNFDRENIETECIKKVTKDEVYDFFMEHISHTGAKRAKLSIWVSGTDSDKKPEDVKPESIGEKDENSESEDLDKRCDNAGPVIAPPEDLVKAEIVTDVHEFKDSMGLFRVMKPFPAPVVVEGTDSEANKAKL